MLRGPLFSCPLLHVHLGRGCALSALVGREKETGSVRRSDRSTNLTATSDTPGTLGRHKPQVISILNENWGN